MREPTDYPTLTLEGRTYVVVPAEEFAELTDGGAWVPAGDNVPWPVVKRHVEGGVSMARAWREYLGLTQQEVAERMGITQAAISQTEAQERPRAATLRKLADALGLAPEQLRS
jgi:DNA-binding XRE family transcriptional regulator